MVKKSYNYDVQHFHQSVFSQRYLYPQELEKSFQWVWRNPCKTHLPPTPHSKTLKNLQTFDTSPARSTTRTQRSSIENAALISFLFGGTKPILALTKLIQRSILQYSIYCQQISHAFFLSFKTFLITSLIVNSSKSISLSLSLSLSVFFSFLSVFIFLASPSDNSFFFIFHFFIFCSLTFFFLCFSSLLTLSR